MNKKNKTTEQKEEKQITVKSIVAALSSGIVDDPNRLSGYLILLTANLWVYGRDKLAGLFLARAVRPKLFSRVLRSHPALKTLLVE